MLINLIEKNHPSIRKCNNIFYSQRSIALEMNVPMKVDKMSMHRIDHLQFTILPRVKTVTGLIACVIIELKTT